MARENYGTLNAYIHKTVIPNLLEHLGYMGNAQKQIAETINWRFFDQIPKTLPHLLNAMQRLFSEAKFENPFFQTIEMLSREKIIMWEPNTTDANWAALQDNLPNSLLLPEHQSPPPSVSNTTPATLYVYSFQQSNTMDMRGKINYFGGASHSSDLLFLMGPSLFQQIGRRKLSQSEYKLCKKMRQYFSDFVKTGNPTPGRLFDAWAPYTRKQKYIQILGSSGGSSGEQDVVFQTTFDRNRAQIEELLDANAEATVISNDISVNPYSLSGSNRKSDNPRISKSYLPDTKDSEYYLVLGRIYSFWNDLLPRIYKNNIEMQLNTDNVTILDSGYLENDNPKFKHAFFSMLTLVCVLLAILGVCVYILKKNNRTINTSYL